MVLYVVRIKESSVFGCSGSSEALWCKVACASLITGCHFGGEAGQTGKQISRKTNKTN